MSNAGSAFLPDLLGAPNFAEILSTGQTGTSVTLQAPSLVRRKSGSFLLQATIDILFGSTGNASCVASISGPTGSVGPAVTMVGASLSKQVQGSVCWIDTPGVGVGQVATYALNVAGGSTPMTMQSAASALVVIEL